jgi:hypothetical protein
MINSVISKFLTPFGVLWRAVLATLFALAIVGSMLAPGYILTLDLVWTPQLPLLWDGHGINNAYPLFAFFHFLSVLVPGWVGEKVLLFSIFFLLLYVPLRYLPFILRTPGRTVGAAIYALNPFVYARMLAGQWLVLLGYALLPFFLHSLVRFCDAPTRRTGAMLGGSLALVALCSIHLAYLALIVSTVWILVHVATHAIRLQSRDARAILVPAGVAACTFVLISSYWLVPALLRSDRLETRFDATNFAAFAAAPNGDVPVLLNVAALGGYWGEATAWGLYFRWPQTSILFWIAFAKLVVLVLAGFVLLFFTYLRRLDAVLLVLVSLAMYVLALGMAHTPFATINAWMYAHMPLWQGLRDSHKIVAFLALGYAIFAGLGIELVWERAQRRLTDTSLGLVPKALVVVAVVLACAVPAVFGMYEWRGMAGQLRAVEYPAGWYAVRDILAASPANERVLVLPWHGYLSFDFANQLVIANPATAFFGGSAPSRFIVSKSVDAGAVHDTELDPAYRALDAVLSASSSPSHKIMRDLLLSNNISYVMLFRNESFDSINRNWTDEVRGYGENLSSDRETEDDLWNFDESMKKDVFRDEHIELIHLSL